METIFNYLKQASTWTGLIKILSAFGLYEFSPEQGAALTENVPLIIAGIIGLLGAFDLLRNEKKTVTE